MATKCTGAELKAFFNDKDFWYEGKDHSKHTYYDDSAFRVNGADTNDDFNPDEVADTDAIEITYGVVFNATQGPTDPSLEAYFKRWKKASTTSYLSVSVPKNLEAAVRAAIAAAGGKVG